jgi:hypothetical protein
VKQEKLSKVILSKEIQQEPLINKKSKALALKSLDGREEPEVH